jgi:hypothetical protein
MIVSVIAPIVAETGLNITIPFGLLLIMLVWYAWRHRHDRY